MTNGQVDLLKLFQAAAGALQQNQTALNQADSYNHDHGTNMVNTFNTIVQALQQKQDAKPAAQLKYVSKQLEQKATSGSGKMFAQNFSQAASNIKGSGITLENILPLLLMILGGGKSGTSGSSTDIIGSILGSLLGGQSTTSSQSGQGTDLGGLLGGLLGSQSTATSSQGSQDSGLGGLLGSILGGQNTTSQPSQGGDLGDILGGALGGQTGSSGSSTGDLLGTLIGGIVGNSGMSDSTHHTQSGQIVTGSILQTLARMLK